MFSKEKLGKKSNTRMFEFLYVIHDEEDTRLAVYITTQGNIHKTFFRLHLYLLLLYISNNSTQNTPHYNFPDQSKENAFSISLFYRVFIAHQPYYTITSHLFNNPNAAIHYIRVSTDDGSIYVRKIEPFDTELSNAKRSDAYIRHRTGNYTSEN